MSSHSSASYGYQPLSPPWSPMPSSRSRSTRYDRAPVMPYVPLPPCDEPHYGLVTPPPSPPRIHPVLSSRTTVVRYDLAADPRTIRMSSSSPQSSFPGRDPASQPSMPVVFVQCELTGHTITVHRSSGVTCSDVLVQLHLFFDEAISRDEWHCVRGAQRDAMKAAYAHRTGRVYTSGARVKMMDYLLGQSVFKCVVPKHSDASGTTWLLQTTSS